MENISIKELTGYLDSLDESLMEGLMTDEGLTNFDRCAMNAQIDLISVVKAYLEEKKNVS